MSYLDSVKPKIRLLLGPEHYNTLLQTLTDNATDKCASEYITEKAGALLDKITRHARPTADDEGADCVDIRFFDNEAKALILQFIFCCTGNPVSSDHYGEFTARRAGTA